MVPSLGLNGFYWISREKYFFSLSIFTYHRKKKGSKIRRFIEGFQNQ